MSTGSTGSSPSSTWSTFYASLTLRSRAATLSTPYEYRPWLLRHPSEAHKHAPLSAYLAASLACAPPHGDAVQAAVIPLAPPPTSVPLGRQHRPETDFVLQSVRRPSEVELGRAAAAAAAAARVRVREARAQGGGGGGKAKAKAKRKRKEESDDVEVAVVDEMTESEEGEVATDVVCVQDGVRDRYWVPVAPHGIVPRYVGDGFSEPPTDVTPFFVQQREGSSSLAALQKINKERRARRRERKRQRRLRREKRSRADAFGQPKARRSRKVKRVPSPEHQREAIDSARATLEELVDGFPQAGPDAQARAHELAFQLQCAVADSELDWAPQLARAESTAALFDKQSNTMAQLYAKEIRRLASTAPATTPTKAALLALLAKTSGLAGTKPEPTSSALHDFLSSRVWPLIDIQPTPDGTLDVVRGLTPASTFPYVPVSCPSVSSSSSSSSSDLFDSAASDSEMWSSSSSSSSDGGVQERPHTTTSSSSSSSHPSSLPIALRQLPPESLPSTPWIGAWARVSSDIERAAPFFHMRRRHLAIDWRKLCQALETHVSRIARHKFRGLRHVTTRTRRTVRAMHSYWRRRRRQVDELRKLRQREAEEQRQIEEEEREARRKRKRLEFLLSRTEIYSRFIQRKMARDGDDDGGDEPANNAPAPASFDLDTATPAEMRAAAEREAAQVAAQRQAATQEFDAQSAALRQQQQQQQADPALDLQNPSSMPENEFAIREPELFHGSLKTYQLKGLNWLANCYEQGINGILADEMGLGKTVQAIAFLAYLAHVKDIWGPFLVVAPKSTLPQWVSELQQFCPALRVRPYWGTMRERGVLRDDWTEEKLYRRDTSAFHVLVTSYDTVIRDHRYLKRLQWQFMLLDEAQAIKNSLSVRWNTLLSLKCRNRLLMTGTPIQNSMAELWALLHFIMPDFFDSHDEFSEWFARDVVEAAQGNKAAMRGNQLRRLHMILKPFMLRRVKADVESEMPPKIEIQVKCPLSDRQRSMYRALRRRVFSRHLMAQPNSTAAAVVAAASSSADANAHKDKAVERDAFSHGADTLMNLVMQLRKVCNHPQLFRRREVSFPLNMTQLHAHGLPASSLANPLDRPLPRLIYDTMLAPHESNDVGFRRRLHRATLTIWHEQDAATLPCMRAIRATVHLLVSAPDATLRFPCHPNSTPSAAELAWLARSGSLSRFLVLSHFMARGHLATPMTFVALDEPVPAGERAVLVESEPAAAALRLHPIVRLCAPVRDALCKVRATPISLVVAGRARAAADEHVSAAVWLHNGWLKSVLLGFDCCKLASSSRYLSSSGSCAAASHLPHLLWQPPGAEASEPPLSLGVVHMLAPDAVRAAGSFGLGAQPTHRELSASVVSVATRALVPFEVPSSSGLAEGELVHVGRETVSSGITAPSMSALITDSGKLRVLDALLQRLLAENAGHRALIFSQMTRMIDLLEMFLRHRGYKFFRLDGRTSLEERHAMVRAYQSDPSVFVFVLSTRAGGLGLNLTAADTVIFYDNDWNPTMDAQAMDRAHRIGNTKQVTVYRLVCRNTVEERILERAQLKYAMQKTVYSGGFKMEQGKKARRKSKKKKKKAKRLDGDGDVEMDGDGGSDDDDDSDEEDVVDHELGEMFRPSELKSMLMMDDDDDEDGVVVGGGAGAVVGRGGSGVLNGNGKRVARGASKRERAQKRHKEEEEEEEEVEEE